jgi:glycine/D-amino acid oxidase-like deaminating enzyme
MPGNDRLVTGTWSAPVAPPASLPGAADVVVIGGGIIGISTAWFLARRGIDVVVCEKGHVAGEQSGRNWGWVRQQGRDTREMPMIMESLAIWRRLADDLGEDVGYTEGGVLFAAKDDEELAQYAAWIESVKDYGLDTRLIERDELDGFVRGASAAWRGALYTASDGRAEPHLATPAIARAAKREGAHVLTGCAVRGIETEAGRTSGVVTEHGTIRTPVVVCAAGAWTSLFCRSLDITVPQLRVRGTVARTAAVDSVCDGNLFDHRLAMRRRRDGGYTLAHGIVLQHAITPATFRFARLFMPALRLDPDSVKLSFGREFFDELMIPKRWALDAETPFEKTRVLDPAPDPKVLATIRENLATLFPALAGTELVESWGGMIETTPDVIPVIDEAGTLPGFYIATGFSGHGFGIGPGAGKAIAALVSGQDPGMDLSAFRLGRFFDGTPIRPQASV